MMKTTLSKLITFTSITTVSLLLTQPKANAFSFAFDPSSNIAGGEFKYDLTLDPGESITQGNGSTILADYLALTNFTGTVTANNIYTLNGSDSSSADFSVNTDTPNNTSNPITLTNVVTINATDFTTGAIDYDLSYSGGSLNGTVTGPVTAVPFESEANLAIFTLLSIWGFNRYRKSKSST